MNRHLRLAADASFAILIAFVLQPSLHAAPPASVVVTPPANSHTAGLPSAGTSPRDAASASTSGAPSEDWKGSSLPPQFTVGGMVGLGSIEGDTGFAVIPFASYTVVQRGFAPDINDSVAVEAEVGPVFVTGNSGWLYSLHLRWDFNKDAVLTPYAIGGIGGSIRNNPAINMTRFLLFPRFGAGVFYKINPNFSFRAELSHELIGIGASFSL